MTCSANHSYNMYRLVMGNNLDTLITHPYTVKYRGVETVCFGTENIIQIMTDQEGDR